MGDRLGLATPGHVRAMQAAGRGIAPIYAQQSIREMTRTGRTPQQVMDDATWGAFAAGWRGHGRRRRRSPEDHGRHRQLPRGRVLVLHDRSQRARGERGRHGRGRHAAEQVRALPWDALDDTADGGTARGTPAAPSRSRSTRIVVDEDALLRAAVKYGRAVCHVLRMYTHLVSASSMGRPFDLEVSVDETDTPTTPAEHLYVASEMRRLGDSLGEPRAALRRPVREGRRLHRRRRACSSASSPCTPRSRATPAPTSSACTRGRTSSASTASPRGWRAGWCTSRPPAPATSRRCARCRRPTPALFREIYVFSRERYETDKQTYHVSADLGRAPAPETLTDAQLPVAARGFRRAAGAPRHVRVGAQRPPGLVGTLPDARSSPTRPRTTCASRRTSSGTSSRSRPPRADSGEFDEPRRRHHVLRLLGQDHRHHRRHRRPRRRDGVRARRLQRQRGDARPQPRSRPAPARADGARDRRATPCWSRATCSSRTA